MSLKLRLSSTIGPILVVSVGVVTVASAQSASPFATKKKKQAWETAPAPQSQPAPSQAQRPQYQPAPVYQAPRTSSSSVPSYTPPPSQSYDFAPPATSQYAQPKAAPASGAYYPGRPKSDAPTIRPYESKPSSSPFAKSAEPPAYENSGSSWGGYAPSPLRDQQNAQSYSGPSYTMPDQAAPQSGSYSVNNKAPQTGYQAGGYPQGPMGQRAPSRGWKDKLGLGRIATLFRGKGRIGAAVTDRDTLADNGWSEDFIADGEVEFEASTVTQNGLEYGINLGVRGQYDKYRRGFGGRLPDCPPTDFSCGSVVIDGTPVALRGHTSRFYAAGADDAKEGEIALESAYLFLRSAYGDVTVGRDDGAAYLFSLGAPTLLAVGASNSPVDYTGLDSVKTVNDASGFSEKITYTSPRLLGDTVGVGVQFGASYAPNARACGVDYCVKKSDVAGTISPDLEDIVEFGVALDRTFDNGLSVEGTATYARGSETSGLAALDDLSAYNAGVEVSLADWTVGGSWLKSNNGLADGDYEAWDAGLTWKPSALGFTLGYGQAIDDNVRLKSNQAVFGVTYDFEKFTLGTGVQYSERKAPAFDGTLLDIEKERATSIFVEGGFTF